MLVTENQLDEWVRANARDAQGFIVELVWRLVAASVPRPRDRRFPLGDSIGQHGPDGILDVDLGLDPYIPEGKSFWEIGTNLDAGDKATADYRGLVDALPADLRQDSTFVFVTPLSARRDWKHTWKEDAQGAWLQQRQGSGEWRDVRVLDGTKLVDWVHQFPAIELWLAQKLTGVSMQGVETPEQRWSLTRSFGEPPPLIPKVFLIGRDEASAKLADVLGGTSVQLKFETHFPNQVVDFVSATIASLEEEARAEVTGRCVLVSTAEAWNALANQREKLILVADGELDLNGELGTKLIQKARRAGHAVVFGGVGGGIPDPASVPFRAPRPQQIQDALEEAGYAEGRARTLSQKSGGNIGSLLRCLQNLSLLPEWAENSIAAELAIAELLGSWAEQNEADRHVVEGVSGKPYGEWIGRMRDVTLRPGTPLVQRDGNWRFNLRYEAWYALGPRMFDDHLDRLREAAVKVLGEADPQFELKNEDRHASSLYGKKLTHSELLRSGLAESVALLGSHPDALTSCTAGRAELVAVLIVRDLLEKGDWQRWASLNHLLPLLAEGAPHEFLRAVENAIDSSEQPFDRLFKEEGDGLFGRTYISGLLWALETLAWEEPFLARASMCLGELAARDPGGRWSNRPANSLTTIFLPWMPQTCASVAKRVSAVQTVVSELPDVGWKLLLSLLPEVHSSSSGTRRPAWRNTIPDSWEKGVTHREYWDQTNQYSGLALTLGKQDFSRLVELVERFASLPDSAQTELLDYVSNHALAQADDNQKLRLWTEFVDLKSKHTKFADAEWALPERRVQEISALSDKIVPQLPSLRHRRLFSERDIDLYEGRDNDFRKQAEELEERRRTAVQEIFANDGVDAILTFAENVDSAWRVGIAFGQTAPPETDALVLTRLLWAEGKLHQFVGGFIWSKFRRGGWPWVQGVTLQWEDRHIAALLTLVTFEPKTWAQVEELSPNAQELYWSRTTANAYETSERLDLAVEQLLSHARPLAALRALGRMLHEKQALDAGLTMRALLAAVATAEQSAQMDSYEITEIIKHLQNRDDVDRNELSSVEWAYVPILTRHDQAEPKTLGRRLSTEPAFFCELIRLIFKSKNDDTPPEDVTEERQRVATNAYRLLIEWRTPPGQLDGGEYDAEALQQWLVAVRKSTVESGHLEVAMTMVGHALMHAPADPGGLWIHRGVAAALNAKDAEDMRTGFRTELFNSRGAHWVDPSGREELALAKEFEGKADGLEEAGFHRLAGTLREMAASYKHEAKQVRSRLDSVD